MLLMRVKNLKLVQLIFLVGSNKMPKKSQATTNKRTGANFEGDVRNVLRNLG